MPYTINTTGMPYLKTADTVRHTPTNFRI